MKSYSIALIVGLGQLALGSASLRACPELIPSHRILWDRPSDIERRSLKLFSFRRGSWSQIPLQLDAMDKDGDLLFPVPEDWLENKIAPFDRLAFNAADFGERAPGTGDLPCPASEIHEIKAGDRFAYIAACKGRGEKAKIEAPPDSPVIYEVEQRLLRSALYRYRYSERNHLVFDDIELADREQARFNRVAGNSDIIIIGDVKKFFTLVFDTDDIDARISHKRQGVLGFVGGLQFFLRVLAFKIELALLPEVNFFEDALFMPMTMYLPVDAKKYLRRGSGVYYSWEMGKDSEWRLDASDIETLDPATVSPDFKGESSPPQTRYCGPSKCVYDIKGQTHGRAFSLNFGISRKAAELGFFPRLIREPQAVEKVLGRPISRFPAAGRVGVYFETARLPEGTHKWDFWIKIESDKNSTCGQALKIRNLSPTKAGN